MSWPTLFVSTPADINQALNAIQSVKLSDIPGTVSDSSQIAYGSRTANTVFAAPSGANGTPSFRALAAADVPTLDTSKIGTGQLALARGGTAADLSATGGTGQVLKQASAGAAITVGGLTIADGVVMQGGALSRTGQNANIASTNLVTAATSGLYLISYYIVITTVGTGTVNVSFGWNDGATTQAGGGGGAGATALNNFASGMVVIRSAASSNITFNVTGVAGGVVYSLYLSAIRTSQ